MVAFALWRRCGAAMAGSIGLLMAAIAAVAAAEQDRFPQRPIRLIVPFTAGGAYDVVARLIAVNGRSEDARRPSTTPMRRFSPE